MSKLKELLVTEGGMTRDEFADVARRVQLGRIWWPMVVMIKEGVDDEQHRPHAGDDGCSPGQQATS